MALVLLLDSFARLACVCDVVLLHVCKLLVWGRVCIVCCCMNKQNAAGTVVAALAVLTSERTAMQGMLTDCSIFLAGPAASS